MDGHGHGHGHGHGYGHGHGLVGWSGWLAGPWLGYNSGVDEVLLLYGKRQYRQEKRKLPLGSWGVVTGGGKLTLSTLLSYRPGKEEDDV
ncbi:hypothetical protein EAF00_009857 [Botryotinia globosa]|nr:hypothetical protein EAF00_009857 [Botryotinia globosa]